MQYVAVLQERIVIFNIFADSLFSLKEKRIECYARKNYFAAGKGKVFEKVTSFLFSSNSFLMTFLLLIPVLFSSRIIMEVIFCESCIKSKLFVKERERNTHTWIYKFYRWSLESLFMIPYKGKYTLLRIVVQYF